MHLVPVCQSGALACAEPRLIQADFTVDLTKALPAGVRMQGIFAMRSSLDPVRRCARLDLAVLGEVEESVEAVHDWEDLRAEEWLLAPWRAAGQAASLPLAHSWFGARKHRTPDLVVFIAVTREGPTGPEIILVEEPESKWSDRGGKWFLPAGHVDPGETYSKAAFRESLEEAGLDIEIDGVMAYRHSGPHLLLAAHAADSAATDEEKRPVLKTTPDKESLSAQWWPLDFVLDTAFAADETADEFFRKYAEMRMYFDIIRQRRDMRMSPVPFSFQ